MMVALSKEKADPLQWSKFKGQPAYGTICEKYLKTISNLRWVQLLEDLLSMKKPMSKYSYAPLSEWDFAVAPGSGAHHAHFGGLALHTLQNLEYAEAWAKIYEARGHKLNQDLLFATIIAHDIMKRFIYKFDDQYNLTKAEDPFIAKKEDHHSWILRELKARSCDRELLFSVAAIHGIDDVALAHGVNGVAIVNHYFSIAGMDLQYTPDDIRPEHVVAFLSDSDWHWSGQAQRKTGILAEMMAKQSEVGAPMLKLYLGSRFSFETVGAHIEKHGYDNAQKFFSRALEG